MKNFNVKQSGSEVILEEVNPYKPFLIDNDDWHVFTPLILTSIDSNIKVGQVIREDQLEPDLWQYKDKKSGEWNGFDNEGTDPEGLSPLDNLIGCHYIVRQVAKLKQPVHETPKSGHDLETCTEKEVDRVETEKQQDPCKVCNGTRVVEVLVMGTDTEIVDCDYCAEQFKPCGEGENICNCKSQSECGYIEIEKRIRDIDRVETPIQEEEKRKLTAEDILDRKDFYGDDDMRLYYPCQVLEAMEEYANQFKVQEHKPESEENHSGETNGMVHEDYNEIYKTWYHIDDDEGFSEWFNKRYIITKR